jgi:hypothetical protein
MATIEYWIQLENKPWDVAPNNIDRLGLAAHRPHELEMPGMPGGEHGMAEAYERRSNQGEAQEHENQGETEAQEYGDQAGEAPIPGLAVRRGDLLLELDRDITVIRRICLPFYREPPKNALYLQLYHEMPGAGMTINGRKYLGNTQR